ncbi:phosphoribosyltransferase family protein [Pseudomonas boanensis]|uniref:phosphoribosyltransferase family protein n=1 Tax=Metapseudomonas boanensis TaxID=2822138 RepID=UPI0035D4508C
MHPWLTRLWQRRPAWLTPSPVCLLCGGTGVDLPICAGCEAELPWLGGRCSICALPLPTLDLPCGECLKRLPPFTRVEAPWRYGFPVDSLITRFKHQGQWPMGRLLAELLGHHLAHAYSEGLPRPAALLPVPLAPRRLRQRGFNQAQMLARWLGDDLGLTVRANWLQRISETPAQQGLDAKARRRNLRQAFDLATDAQPAGLHLAIVDDVLTTGTTAHYLARLLKRHGAERVDIYCLARTPSPGDS